MARLRSLRASLGWLLFSVAIPLVAAGAALLTWQWHQQREQAVERLQEQARSLRIAVDRELALDRAVMEVLAASQDIDRRDWASFHAVAGRASAVRSGSWFILVAPDGTNILNTSVPYGAPLPHLHRPDRPQTAEWNGRVLPLPDLQQFVVPFETGQPVIGDLVFGPVARRPVVGTTVPVVRDGRTLYVLGLAYAPELFGQVLGMDEGEGGAIKGLVDGNGRLVARSRAPAESLGRAAPPPFDRGLAAFPAEGTGEARTLDGVPAYFAFSRSTLSDWGVVVGMPKAAVLAPAWRALGAWIAVLLVAGAIGLYFVLRLWRRLAPPLDTLASRARALNEGRALEAEKDVPPTDVAEVEALRTALHEGAVAELERRRTEREREEAREELRLANERLVEADRRKDEFLAMLSHELRNPLGAIRNVAAILTRDASETPRARALNEILNRQTLQLSRLVDDLLDVARIRHGSVRMHMRPVRLDAMARRVAGDARATMDARGHRFTVEAGGDVTVTGDEARLTQMIQNLLDNAAKYTPPGGEVTLTVGREGKWGVVRVADSGAGIEPPLLPHVFDLFMQGARTLDRSQGGLGIGLTLVKNIVEAHGGSVTAHSAGAGQGSAFVVRLPLLVRRAPDRRAGAGDAGTAVSGRRLLVVEDNVDVAETLSMLLRMEGNEVEVAHDGARALEMANLSRPEAVLLDIGLPSMSGREVCRALRLQGWSRRIPIIALTGWGQEDDRRLSREAGFDGHLVKPVDPVEMMRLLASLLSDAASAAPRAPA